MINGRRNWGIPKAQYDFDVRYGEGGIDRVRASFKGKNGEGEVFADLSFRPFGPSLAFATCLLPVRLRMLQQRIDGKEFSFGPLSRGWFRPARLVSAKIDPRHFPDISRGRVLAALRATSFDLTFPTAAVRPQR